MYNNPQSKMRFGLDERSQEIRDLKKKIKKDKRKKRK